MVFSGLGLLVGILSFGSVDRAIRTGLCPYFYLPQVLQMPLSSSVICTRADKAHSHFSFEAGAGSGIEEDL